MTTQARSFGDQLRRYRVAAGLSQEALAERARLSTRAISDLERGVKQTPRRDTVDLLVEALALSAQERADLEATISRRRGPTPPPTARVVLSSAHPHNLHLPTPPTSLVGRDREVAAVADLLRQRHVRLLTLSGPGGVGKTRLILEVARAVSAEYPDGVWFVSLASCTNLDLVASAIVQTLGLHESGGQALERHLARYLRDKRLLLLLDNFEQALAAAALVADLLATCPDLTIMVTSQALLHLRGEQDFPVEPLALPAASGLPDGDLPARYPALDLFIQRAHAAKPDFHVTPDQMPVVTEICRRLDGLPLALELAAARVKLLPLPALLVRLERRLHVLTGGPRDLPERQQTMRSTVAWSYSLLDAHEQRVFRRLAVFAGGCTLAAAAAVAVAVAVGQSAGAGVNPDDDILDDLGSLVDKSLLRQRVPSRLSVGEAEPRFEMLQTIREYALERLTEEGELDAVQRQHACHYLALVQGLEPQFRGPKQGHVLARLDDEHDNVRAALQWATEGGEVETGLRLATSVWGLWWLRGHFTEGRGWLEDLLTRVEGGSTRPCDPVVYARGLVWAAVLATELGDYGRAVERAERGLAFGRESGDHVSSALALNALGTVAQYRGDYDGAAGYYEESLALCRAMGDRWGSGLLLNNLGVVAYNRGDDEQARALYDEGIALARVQGDLWCIAMLLDNLGEVVRDQGDYDRAAVLSEDSLALRRQLGDVRGIADALNSLGFIRQLQGYHAPAAELYGECLLLYRRVGDRWGSAVSLEGLALVAMAQQDAERAAQLFGAAAALRDAIGAPWSPAEHARYDETLAQVRADLGEGLFHRAWSRGPRLYAERVKDKESSTAARSLNQDQEAPAS